MAIIEDVADGNIIRGNTFENNRYGIRVEDDDTVIEGNAFTSGESRDIAVIVGTKFRTEALGDPVSGTDMSGNRSDIPQSPAPYVWIHGHEGTQFVANTSHGRRSYLRPGKQPKMEPFLLTESIWFVERPGQ